jgi:succinyl-CoA synthetase beta subunit
MASAAGGVDIEEVAQKTPEKIVKCHIDPLMGLQEYQSRDLAAGIDLPRKHWRAFGKIAAGLWQAYLKSDATLAEINPLVVTAAGELLAVDGKMVLDDNALFRHPDLEKLRDTDVDQEAEIQARENGLSYIKLDGDIGCMVNGAGLAMTTMDIIKLFGGEPANFLDIGGGASSEKVAAALEIILSDPNVKAVLFNIFGGITRCDLVAKGILEALETVDTEVPMVVRLVGTNAAEGRQLLKDADMETADTLAEAAQKAVEAAKNK